MAAASGDLCLQSRSCIESSPLTGLLMLPTPSKKRYAGYVYNSKAMFSENGHTVHLNKYLMLMVGIDKKFGIGIYGSYFSKNWVVQ